MSLVMRFVKDESGATATDIVAGIALAILAVAHALATQLSSLVVHASE